MATPTQQQEIYSLAYHCGIPQAAAAEILRRFSELEARIVLLEQALRAQAPTAPPCDYVSRDH